MIRVAIVGTGNISQAHIQAYLTFPQRCKIVALVDIMPEKAEEKKARFGLDCDVYDDHLKILDRRDIDLVDVCTPPYVHAQISINAMRAGKNVVCEKPMAASLEECDAVLRTAQETGMMFSSIAQNRFRTPVKNLKALSGSELVKACRSAEGRLLSLGAVLPMFITPSYFATAKGVSGLSVDPESSAVEFVFVTAKD